MLSFSWGKIVDFFEKLLNEKRFKFILLLLIMVFLTFSYYNTAQIQELSEKVENIPVLIKQQDSAIESRFDRKIDRMYSDNSAVLEMYATSSKEDLTKIIDYCVTIKDNAELLKALIEKTSHETIHEIRKQQLNQRYNKHDSLSIEAIPLGIINPLKSLYVYACKK